MSYYENDSSGWFANGEGAQGGGGGWDQGGYAQQAPQQDYYSSNAGGWDQAQTNNYGFMPNAQAPEAYAQQAPGPGLGESDVNFADEPPLLEELGINFSHIRQKTLAVLNPLGRASQDVISDQDLAGPLVFCLLFGAALLMQGKVHFGYIYGIGVLGCAGMYGLLNLMASDTISVTCTVSVLGYCLLPMALLSLLAALASFKGVVGLGLAGLAVVWCSASASKLFTTALSMDHQAALVAYPCGLLYAVFALLAIF